MSRLNHVQSVLDDYAAELGIAAIPLDSRQRAALHVGDADVLLSMSSESLEMLVLHCKLGNIGALDDGDSGDASRYLLQAGGESWLQQGITLGLGGDGSTAFAMLTVPVVLLDIDSLRNHLIQLLETSFKLRQRLAQGDFGDLDATPGAAPNSLPPAAGAIRP